MNQPSADYAIETLQIELYKLIETQRVEDRYSAHPEYRPSQVDYRGMQHSIMYAIQLLKKEANR